MWKKKRKVKLRRATVRTKHRFHLPIILAVVVVFLGCGILCALLYLRSKPLFVSPVSIIRSFTRPETADQKELDIVKHSLSQNKIAFDSLKLGSSNTVIINVKDQGEVILSTKRNVDEQISSLQYILARLTMEGKRFSRLDMEFDKPVINF